jgi:hypothetical protein
VVLSGHPFADRQDVCGYDVSDRSKGEINKGNSPSKIDLSRRLKLALGDDDDACSVVVGESRNSGLCKERMN